MKFTMVKIKNCLVWLRNDLRFHDNEALLWAHENAEAITPFYCFDPRLFTTTHRYHFPKTGNFRSKFLLECVDDLKKTLKAKGSDLIVSTERPEDAIQTIQNKCKFEAFVFQKEITKEEVDVETACERFCSQNGIIFRAIWGSTLYHKDDLPYAVERIPDTYTLFRKDVETRCKVRTEKRMPDKLKAFPVALEGVSDNLPSLHDLKLEEPCIHPRSAFPFLGGETAALSRLKSNFWDTNAVKSYKITRNGLLGTEYSTKLSPWLAFGCISPRRIFYELKKYEADRVKNDSTYWVIFELLWRDYFRFIAAKYGSCLFYSGGIKNLKYNWSEDMEKFNKFANGQTGVPFVDANMRELRQTGWMSNRGRQNVASFLTKDLKLDWRMGAEWFEYLLDVCSNYGNWNYSAGIGNDPREDRKFNMVKQGLDYDAEGEYIRTWVPELSRICGGKIHVPWTLRHSELGGIKLDVDYPNPMVITLEWRRHLDKSNSSNWAASSRTKQKGHDFYFKSGQSKK
ncbi:Cryptochrome DASH [Pseudolycoriella hygida]|uniref:Cryptochrome DASH n=1 Tax=Pseudolycoriella hygida TaxID=35572 RepID=A0A9Q0S6Q1_9DIPT|nr:Cryptochrome DASH [Pseudolycoriella hygida]